MKSWLEKSDIKMYSMHNEVKPTVAEIFNRALKNKICKYMTTISKNVYIDKLFGLVNKYNNTYHRTKKMKLADVKSSTYINYNKILNDEDSKFKTEDIVRMSKHINIFAKDYVPN